MANVTDELFSEPNVRRRRRDTSRDGREPAGEARCEEGCGARLRCQDVSNQLEVKLLAGNKRDDSDLRRDILQALMLDTLVPSTVGVKVEGGYATLTGTPDRHYAVVGSRPPLDPAGAGVAANPLHHLTDAR